MPTLNFQKRFAPLVESGQKRQTIRARRVDMRDPKPGQTLYLYVGQRTKGCRKLGESVCKSVHSTFIDRNMMILDGRQVSYCAASGIATANGFECVEDLVEFLEQQHHELPFEGILICW